jgi:trans-2,3-dihydro-3-hydroxyanthranilate isomerase
MEPERRAWRNSGHRLALPLTRPGAGAKSADPNLAEAVLSYRYVILDVFTDTPLAGNPLAVLPDADGLDDARMQAVAAEFNLSETVFCFRPANPVHTAAVRIFTPRRELPFAGHPTVGTAVYLAADRLRNSAALAESVTILEEGVGPVRCGVFLKPNGRGGHAIFDAPRLPEPVAVNVDREALAASVGLTPSEIGFENHVPTAFTAGLPYVFVPVRNLDVIAKIAPSPSLLSGAIGTSAVYAYCRDTVGVGRQFHARMFVPALGIMEDPATGSAAAAFPGVIKHFDAHPSGTHRFVIEQGFEMGRPSLIVVEVDIEGSGVAAVRIGGDAVVVAEGTLDV